MIDKLIACRKLYDEFHDSVRRGDTTQELFDKLMNGLKESGFETIKDFMQTNRKLCLLESLKCYRRVSSCDGCEGRTKACYPDCRASQVYDRLPVLTTESYRMLLTDIEKSDNQKVDGWLSIYGTYLTWRNFPDNVPPGCAVRFEKIKEPDFDITWRMPMVTKARYEADKKTWGK